MTVEQGTNYLAGTDPADILAASGEILSGRGKIGTVPPLWDGHAAEWIADILPRIYFVQSPTRCAISSSFDD